MKHTYFFIEDKATANLMYCGNNTWMLTGIEVHRLNRHNGVASRLLKEVLDDADHEGVRMVLGVSPDGSKDSLTYDELERWYARNGFVHDEGDDTNIMRREPKCQSTDVST